MNRSILYITVLMLAACNSSQRRDQEEEKQLQTKLLKMHDHIMPEMETVVHKEAELQKMLRAIRSPENRAADTIALAAPVHAALSGLKKADDSMMDWMDGLNLDFQQKTHKQIMTYLSNEYRKVGHVDSTVSAALAASARLTHP